MDVSSSPLLMARAIELAKKAVGFVSPNPLVGAVIVKNGKIIGEGFHEYFGGTHAEKNAIIDAEKKGLSVENSEIYVTLEPCNHYGKTPPCADLLIQKKIRKVFIATKDPNPVSSGGIEKLQKAGIAVETGILEEEAKKLNRFFFHAIERKRPFFLGKSAISKNGFVAEKKGFQTQITGAEAQIFTHRLRMQCDGILIGAETAIRDNPLLSVRFGEKRRDPVRIILDPKERVPKNAQVFRDNNYLLFTSEKSQISNKNSILLKIDSTGSFDLNKLSHELFYRNICSVLIEGGPKTIHSFLKENLLDELIIIQSEKRLENLNGIPLFSNGFPDSLQKVSEEKVGEDTFLCFRHSFGLGRNRNP